MVNWSSMLRLTGPKLIQYSELVSKRILSNGQTRCMSSERMMEIKPSSWQWDKTKDLFHFYFMLGVIPLGTLIFLVNICIGPATLQKTPEGYTPKYWEYHRHPITRFISRYMMPPPQQEYERTLDYIWRESRNVDIRRLEVKVKDLIRERLDYQMYYYQPRPSKYIYQAREREEKLRLSLDDEELSDDE